MIEAGINGNAIEVSSKDGKRMPLRLDTVTPDERRRLVFCDPNGKVTQPAAFWLSEIGLPVAPNSWEAVFARASRADRPRVMPTAALSPSSFAMLLVPRSRPSPDG